MLNALLIFRIFPQESSVVNFHDFNEQVCINATKDKNQTFKLFCSLFSCESQSLVPERGILPKLNEDYCMTTCSILNLVYYEGIYF